MGCSTSASAGEYALDVVPTNPVASTILFVLFVYFFIRHFLFVTMMMDIFISWLRKFSWFPKGEKRLNAVGHWLAAAALLAGFIIVGSQVGWVEYVSK